MQLRLDYKSLARAGTLMRAAQLEQKLLNCKGWGCAQNQIR